MVDVLLYLGVFEGVMVVENDKGMNVGTFKQGCKKKKKGNQSAKPQSKQHSHRNVIYGSTPSELIKSMTSSTKSITVKLREFIVKKAKRDGRGSTGRARCWQGGGCA